MTATGSGEAVARAAVRGRQGETAQRILDAAERLVQARGFNAFSYADVASELGITKASLHYHFAGKAQLGRALIERYARRFLEALQRIEAQEPGAPATLAAYAELYEATLRRRRMCLCGMLAAEYQTLDRDSRAAVVEFFDANEAWLLRVLQAGREQGTLRFDGAATDTARMVIGALEGAMLVARPYGDADRFAAVARTLLHGLSAGPRA
jgi:TetR/AcrR family transcriptional repressor of nem operon